MRRLLLILTFIIFPLGLSAQTALDDIYDDYAGKKGYQSVVYGKKMISMMKENASADVCRLLNGISMIRIISYKGSETALYDDARDIVRKEHELISQMEEEGSCSLFYLYETDDDDDDMSFVMIASDQESKVVLEIIGRFDVKDISKLSIIGQKK